MNISKKQLCLVIFKIIAPILVLLSLSGTAKATGPTNCCASGTQDDTAYINCGSGHYSCASTNIYTSGTLGCCPSGSSSFMETTIDCSSGTIGACTVQ